MSQNIGLLRFMYVQFEVLISFAIVQYVSDSFKIVSLSGAS